MSSVAVDLKEFLDASPTAYHAVDEIEQRLKKAGCVSLDEKTPWKLSLKKSYFFSRGGTVAAFRLPSKKPSKAIIIAAHTDSPSFRLKPKPEFEEAGMTMLRVEAYGSPILSTWVDRDLIISGRVFYLSAKGELISKLVSLPEYPCIIPSLAIHLEEKKGEEPPRISRQDHLCPILANKTGVTVSSLLEEKYKIKKILSMDLFLTPKQTSDYVGVDKELLASYRIDNLSSAHSCLEAFLASTKESSNVLKIALFWNNEEIGSSTEEGAHSPLLADLLQRLGFNLNMTQEDLICLKNNSFAISVDMAHATHPNYVSKHDPKHKLVLGAGPVIKYQASRRYATTAASAGRIMAICQKHKIPFQEFAPRSDMTSGSTIGPIQATVLGIETVDIGAPQLAMHSSRELMAIQDHMLMTQLLHHALDSF